jgi:hypothetical protein
MSCILWITAPTVAGSIKFYMEVYNDELFINGVLFYGFNYEVCIIC